MTLPVAYNTIQMSQVNTELGRASNYANSSLGESAVRTLAGVASGTISFNNLHGKSNFTPSLAAGSYIAYRTGGSVTATLAFNTNGSLSKSTTSSVDTDTLGTTWGTPTGGTPGNNYWLYYTMVSGAFTSASMNDSTWAQLSSNLSFTRNRLSTGQSDAVATFYISTTNGMGGLVTSAQITLGAIYDII